MINLRGLYDRGGFEGGGITWAGHQCRSVNKGRDKSLGGGVRVTGKPVREEKSFREIY